MIKMSETWPLPCRTPQRVWQKRTVRASSGGIEDAEYEQCGSSMHDGTARRLEEGSGGENHPGQKGSTEETEVSERVTL